MLQIMILLIALMGIIGMATILVLLTGMTIRDNRWFQLAVLAVFGTIYYFLVSHFDALATEGYPFAQLGVSINVFVATAFAATTNVPFVAYVIVSAVFGTRDALMGDRGSGSRPMPDSAQLAEQEGDFSRAKELLMAAIQEKPADMATRFRLAKLYLKMGSVRDAVVQLGRVSESREEAESFPAAVELAELALDGKVEVHAALRALSLNLGDFPGSPLARRAQELVGLLRERRNKVGE